MASTAAHKRHTSGLVVVVLLGIVFFALLAMLLLHTGKPHTQLANKAETLTVLPVRIRLRTEPNAKAPVVATATTGEQLTLLEDRGTWVRVQDSDGLAGWAERNNLERTSERERRLNRYAAIRKLPALRGEATERTPLYAGPGIFYPLVGELPAGTEVNVFTRDHDFYAVDHYEQVAYADIDSIAVTAARGSPQLDVGTSTSPTSTIPTETLPPETASATPTETAPARPAPLPPVEEPSSGVYAAVPPGGTQPEEIERVVPRYPAGARASGAYGSVVIRGIVRKDGTIDDVEIIKDLPYGLGDAARDAVRRWRFRPATFRGEPIDVYYTVTVNFRLR
ncbi:MAG: TonB family protein [Thermoanaerobaculia bacterium]